MLVLMVLLHAENIKSSLKTFAVTQLWTYLDVGTLDLAGGDMGLNIVNNIVKDVW